MFIKIGIDLGTANTTVYLPQKGIVLTEPTVVAVDELTKKIIAVGQEAKDMIGKTPGDIKIYRPLREGVIADYRSTLAILKYFLNKTKISKIFKPLLIISVPAGITSTERKAVIDAALEAGAKEVYPIREPLLAALGADLSINSPSGHMIVNIGGGTTEIAVISLGGIVSWESIRIAGDKFDESIKEYLRKKFNLAIGDKTAELIKIQVGAALIDKNTNLSINVNGVNILTGLPMTIKINSSHIVEALQRDLREIILGIKKVLSHTPPELVADIMEKGIVISGGGALLRNIDQLIYQQTGVAAFVANDPLYCVARGTGKIIEKLDIYRRVLISHK
ncbi:MAG: rod shape-determining protein [Candidatus Parcubacteria bacterium]|nr:MAG: rod shape-determining protein [Candidatus Parcubacteria bacterium]